MYKIEIKRSPDDLQRISIFLANNHIEHHVIDDVDYGHELAEIEESINWPF